jgi:hypothetical protein
MRYKKSYVQKRKKNKIKKDVKMVNHEVSGNVAANVTLGRVIEQNGGRAPEEDDSEDDDIDTGKICNSS